ncbi:MAG TPA: CDP-alcohol phosphatidyltransferase family protein [Chloroflexota bacterium]|nr:CDP-alcohol phosphatidyltransferase family protein [Chloroflexota bacterium]
MAGRDKWGARASSRLAGPGWGTLARSLTLARIGAIPVVLLLLALPHPAAPAGAAAVFAAAALTDALDGPLARRARQVGPLGAALDLTADKLLVTIVLIDLATRQLAPAWVAMVVVARELIVSGVRAYAGTVGLPLGVRPLGKLKMAVMSVAVPLAILRLPGAGWLLILACALTVASAWPYLIVAGAVLKGDPLKGECGPPGRQPRL